MANEARSRIVVDGDTGNAVAALDDLAAAADLAARELDDLDGTDVAPDADVSGLDDVGTAASAAETDLDSLSGAEVRIDTDKAIQDLARFGGSVDGLADTLETGIGPARGALDALGNEAISAGGEITNAFIDAGESARIFGPRMGFAQESVDKFAGALGIAGVAVGAASVAWDLYSSAAKRAAEVTEEMIRVQEQLAEGKVDEAVNTLKEGYADLFADLERYGVSSAEVFEALADDNVNLADSIDTSAEAIKTYGRDGYAELVKLKSETGGLEAAWASAGEEIRRDAELTDELTAALEQSGLVGTAAAEETTSATQTMGTVSREVWKGIEDSIYDVDAAYRVLTDDLDDREAYLRLKDSFDSVEDAAVTALEAAAAGEENAERKARDHQQAVIDLQQDVARYGEEVLGLPPEKITDIIADIDEGSVAAAERAIDQAAADQTATVWVRTIREQGWIGPGSTYPGASSSSSRTTNVTVNARTAMSAREVTKVAGEARRMLGD